MLRITIDDRPPVLTLRLEGRLVARWLPVVEETWRDTLVSRRRPTLSVDLTGVTFIDEAGRACLKDLHRQGAAFVAGGCLTRAIVAEIIEGGGPAHAAPGGQVGDSR